MRLEVLVGCVTVQIRAETTSSSSCSPPPPTETSVVESFVINTFGYVDGLSNISKSIYKTFYHRSFGLLTPPPFNLLTLAHEDIISDNYKFVIKCKLIK